MLSDSELESLGESADRKWRTTKKIHSCGHLVCALLEGNSCKVYSSRPKLCRVYPFMAAPVLEFVELGLTIASDAIRHAGSNGVEYVILFDESCPGIGTSGGSDPVCVGRIVELTINHLADFKQLTSI
jgi:Fe-S-cluster containining protein